MHSLFVLAIAAIRMSNSLIILPDFLNSQKMNDASSDAGFVAAGSHTQNNNN